MRRPFTSTSISKKGEGVLSFTFGCYLQHRYRVCACAVSLLERGSLHVVSTEVFDQLFADRGTTGEDVHWGKLVELTLHH